MAPTAGEVIRGKNVFYKEQWSSIISLVENTFLMLTYSCNSIHCKKWMKLNICYNFKLTKQFQKKRWLPMSGFQKPLPWDGYCCLSLTMVCKPLLLISYPKTIKSCASVCGLLDLLTDKAAILRISCGLVCSSLDLLTDRAANDSALNI